MSIALASCGRAAARFLDSSMGHSQGASLAGTVPWPLLSSVGRMPRELVSRGQNPMNGDTALLAGFSLLYNVEWSHSAQLDNDLWVTRGSFSS